jgi:NAD(P)-dependent dehydrogenase (short-subunit alcohol dehydrogenase family)
VVLVVGGSGYIGAAVADRLREEGAEVVVASRHPDGGLEVDAHDPGSVRAGVEQVLAQHGRLDGVVITAAPSARTLDPARRNDPEQVADAIEGKALTFLRVANAVLPAMQDAGFGRIVGISGQNAWLTGSGVAGPVRNAALIVAAKNLADEVAGSGVAINVVNPGQVTDDPAAEVGAGQGGQSSPAQIAALVAFLLSPVSAVSGESIAIGHRVRGFTTL